MIGEKFPAHPPLFLEQPQDKMIIILSHCGARINGVISIC